MMTPTLHRTAARSLALSLLLLLTACQGQPGKSYFDGKSLGKWEPTKFGGEGEVTIEDGVMVLGYGDPMTGVTWTGKDDFPRMNYEITLEANRLDGTDFFCGLTFPVNDKPLTFVVGGWGGSLCGISSLEGMDAANNETAVMETFFNKRWYKIRLRVTEGLVKAWIDDKQVVDLELEGRQLGIRPEVELSVPLGICSFQTTAGIRNIRIREIKREK